MNNRKKRHPDLHSESRDVYYKMIHLLGESKGVSIPVTGRQIIYVFLPFICIPTNLFITVVKKTLIRYISHKSPFYSIRKSGTCAIWHQGISNNPSVWMLQRQCTDAWHHDICNQRTVLQRPALTGHSGHVLTAQVIILLWRHLVTLFGSRESENSGLSEKWPSIQLSQARTRFEIDVDVRIICYLAWLYQNNCT